MTDDGPGLDKRLRYEANRISSQHKKLDELYDTVRHDLDRRARHTAYVSFGRFRDALEAHFEIEDRVYFPAVHGMCPEHRGLLDVLSADHVGFCEELLRIHKLLGSHELDESDRRLKGLVVVLRDHEKREDGLLAILTGSQSA
jgi:iron-sulfur cluster repair protein YtfE (RIC family)